MMFFLTSFKNLNDNKLWDHEDNTAWSSAVYQPGWYEQLPKAQWMDIRPDFKGNWIRPREYLEQDEPLEGYFQALQTLYRSRIHMVEEWIESLNTPFNIICCWCPYDKAAKRQLQEFGTFVCHTAAVGDLLKSLNYEVVHDSDRLRMVKSETYIG